MKYFDISEKRVILHNMVYGVPCIKELHDKMEDKDLFFKYVSYAIFKTHYNSPYKAYDADIREKILKKDVFKDENFKITKELEQFTEDIAKFTSTPLMRLLDAAEESVDFLIEEYKNLKMSKYEEDPRKRTTAKDVLDWNAKLMPAVKSLATLRDEVVKEQLASSKKVRGQAEVGAYEDYIPTF